METGYILLTIFQKRLENTEICYIIFPFLDAVATHLLQKLVKGLASLIYLKTYTQIVLEQHLTLCPNTWGWTTGLALVLPSLQMFHKTMLQNQRAACLVLCGDRCFRQVSLIRLGIQPVTHDILNALVYMQTMKTQFFHLHGSTSELERHKPERN